MVTALCLFLAGTRASASHAQTLPAAASAAFEEGRYEDVLTALVSMESPEARYLRARALAELGRPGEALDTLGEAPQSWPEAVREDVRALRVEWSADAGRCGTLDELSKAQPKDGKAQRLLARCLFAAGDFARAAQLLADAKDVSGQAMLVRALAKLNQYQKAYPIARTLYLEHPNHGQAREWQALLSRDKPLRLTVEEHFKRAEGFIKARNPEQAHAELAGLDKRTPYKLRARLWHLRGEALFRTRKDYDRAERAYTRAVQFKGPDEDHNAFHAIRSASRAGKDPSAIRRYRAFVKRYPKSSYVPQALYLSAWLSARGKGADARNALRSFVTSKEAKRAPRLRRDAIWDLAWLAIERGDAHDAMRWLTESASLADSPMQAARVAYWQGRAAQLLRDPKRARTYYEAALTLDRLGYYAQLAARRLMDMGDPPPPAFAVDAPVPAAPPQVTPPPAVAFYRELGLWSDAAAAATSWAEGQRDRYGKIAAYIMAGDAVRAHSTAVPVMQEVLAAPPSGPAEWLWGALFPRPYAATVEANTAKQGLPTALFYGHMQVESRYRPAVVSGADAIGLMQLLPTTAAKVAEGLPGVPAHRKALVRPHVNVTIAAQYLAGLVARYNGQLPPAIAAYNAGTHRIDGWLTKGKPVELDRWVERIPIEQTRNYVRRVISAYSRYHAMEAPEAPWDLPLPEVLSLDGSKKASR